MTKAANDNEPNTWRSIGFQTALIVNKLRCDAQIRELSKIDEQKQEQSERDRQRSRKDDKRADDHTKYVEQRLRDYATFERRYIDGGKKDAV